MLKEEIEGVKILSRIIAKEEIGAMDKLLEATSKKLEAEIKDLETKIAKLKEFAEELERKLQRQWFSKIKKGGK